MNVFAPALIALGAPPQGGNPLPTLIMFALMVGIFYFVVLLPMNRQRKKVDAFQSGLKVGDRVITSGGIYGTVTKLDEKSVQLQIADKVRVEASRAAIVGYQGQEPVVPESGGAS